MARGGKQTAKRATARAVATAKRLTHAVYPETAEEVEFPWVRDRLLHNKATRCFGEITLSIVQSQAWREVMDPQLDLWKAERELRPDGRRKRGPKPLYTPRDCEIVELVRRVGGFTTYEAT